MIVGLKRVFVYRQPCDMRRGFFSLAGLVETMGHEVSRGDAFVFVARNRKRCKTIWHDRSGLCLLQKLLDNGLFAAPWQMDGDAELELSHGEMALFFDGCTLIGKVPLSPRRSGAETTTTLQPSDWT